MPQAIDLYDKELPELFIYILSYHFFYDIHFKNNHIKVYLFRPLERTG